MRLKKLSETIRKNKNKLFIVIGAIWGLLSGFLFPACNISASWYMCFIPASLFVPILLLPIYLSVILFRIFHIIPTYSAEGGFVAYYFFIIPISVFIGALLGALLGLAIGYLTNKYKK